MFAKVSGFTLLTVILGAVFYSQSGGGATNGTVNSASSTSRQIDPREANEVVPGDPAQGRSQAARGSRTASGARQSRRSAGAKSPSGPSAAAQSPTLYPCYRDAYRLVQEFFGPPPDSPPDLMSLAEKHGYTVEFLIASLPDPVDSKLGWRYDLYLDAIQRALEANHLVQDRFSLPWKCASKDVAATVKNRPRLQESEPGVVLFRHLDRPHLLVLFLIGERPTSGISKGAFLRALDCMRACKKWDRQVRIMGPATSGAVLSLRLALQDCYARAKREDKGQDPLQFTIISGSATRDTNKQTLVDPIDNDPNAVRFYATVNPDGASMAALRAYLYQTDPDAKVAVLTESNTAYGQGAKTAVPGSNRGQEQENSADEHDDHWLVIPFPMQISQLRSDYEKEKRLEQQAASTANVTANKPRTNLSLPLEELGEAQDSPPAFTPSMTSAEADLVVTNILSSISRMNVKYVGLLGTDTRDKLFFAQQIRKYCPDVRLFTFETDILYTHPDCNSYLAGMIVVSTYPFFDKSQAWALWPKQAKPDNSLLHFPMEGAKGAYNATLALLTYDRDGNEFAGVPALIDYGGLVQKSTSSGVGKPPVWLTLVGRNAFWPLRVFADVPQSDGYLFPAADPGAVALQGQITANTPVRFRAGALLWVAFLVVSLVSAASCVGRAKYGSGSERKSLAPIFRSPFRHQREHSFWLFCYFLTLICLYGGLASFVIIEPIADLAFQRRHGVLDLVGIALISALFIALALATLATLAETLPLAGWRKLVAKRRLPAALDQHWIRQALPFVFSLACGGVAAQYLPHTVRQAGDGAIGPVILCYGPVFYARAISLASGVSPVMGHPDSGRLLFLEPYQSGQNSSAGRHPVELPPNGQ